MNGWIGIWCLMIKIKNQIANSFFAVLFCFIGLGFSSVEAATYYVDKTGNDSGLGTQTQPWLTIQKAANTATAGDTVLVGAGAYPEKVTINVSGVSGSPVTFATSGNVTVGGFYVTGSYVVVRGFSLDGTGVNANEGAITLTATANFNSFSDMAVNGSHDLTSSWGGIQTYGNDGTFSNISITNPHGHSIVLIGVRNLVSGCHVTDSNGWDIFRVVGSDNRIAGCTITASNPLANPNHCDIIQSFNDAGDVVSQNVIFENNLVTQGTDYQFGNITDDQENGAISNWTFRNNIFVDVTNCLNLYAPGFHFYNNTFVRVGATSGWVIIWGSGSAGHANDTDVRNNIFYQCGMPDRANDGWYGGDPVTGAVADNNLVVGTGAGLVKAGFQANGFEAHGLNGQDPLFVNSSLGDFHLQAGSPAIGAGVALNNLFTTDFYGTSRGSAWDLGALEAKAGTPGVTDIFVSQNGNGAGTSCSDSRSVAWFNAASSWGTAAGQISSGVTVHLCGTISTALTVLGSGVLGNPISIYFEPNAKLSAPVNRLWLSAHGQNWVTVDGGQNGAIENTDNGTAGAINPLTGVPFGHQAESWAVEDGNNCCTADSGGNGITVKNLTIRNLYVRTPHTDDPNQFGMGFYLGGSNVTVSNVTVSQAITGIFFLAGTGTNNFTVDSCTVTATNHAIEIGGGAGTSLNNINLTNTTIDGFDVWEQLTTTIDLGFHRNGIFFHTDGSMSNIFISRNRIGPGFNPKTVTAGTGGMFFDGNLNRYGTYNNVYIFNNIFTLKAPLGWSGCGATCPGGEGSNLLVANNTVVASGGASSLNLGLDNGAQYNNIVYNSATGISVGSTKADPITRPISIDYNLYSKIGPSGSEFTTFFYNGTSDVNLLFDNTLAEWQANTPWDHHSLSVDPLLVNSSATNGDYHLQANSPAIGAGTNLTSYCAMVPGLCLDYNGKYRPATGPWDIGAFQYRTYIAPPPTTPPSPPERERQFRPRQNFCRSPMFSNRLKTH